ncbi:uncharacterized protein LOC102372854 [Alligator sinensis]|uniref:Uncharacterized protein LOC102372854 n=1 Tax=Alligator sinensis TaxID=38654 RepID=A0A3Q0FSB0_ALLSI|nr:uncharacterized protein LOC102372854 [Alligator sinensis]
MMGPAGRGSLGSLPGWGHLRGRVGSPGGLHCPCYVVGAPGPCWTGAGVVGLGSGLLWTLPRFPAALLKRRSPCGLASAAWRGSSASLDVLVVHLLGHDKRLFSRCSCCPGHLLPGKHLGILGSTYWRRLLSSPPALEAPHLLTRPLSDEAKLGTMAPGAELVLRCGKCAHAGDHRHQEDKSFPRRASCPKEPLSSRGPCPSTSPPERPATAHGPARSTGSLVGAHRPGFPIRSQTWQEMKGFTSLAPISASSPCRTGWGELLLSSAARWDEFLPSVHASEPGAGHRGAKGGKAADPAPVRMHWDAGPALAEPNSSCRQSSQGLLVEGGQHPLKPPPAHLILEVLLAGQQVMRNHRGGRLCFLEPSQILLHKLFLGIRAPASLISYQQLEEEKLTAVRP